MTRKSTGLVDIGSDPLEIKSTGLRPSWGAFWAVDSIPKCSVKSDIYRKCTTSTISFGTSKSHISIRHVKFVTGSDWIGEWDKLGMCGVGTYRMPHGVIYEGAMNGGVFEGIGTLSYPNGGALEGFWEGGNLKYCQYSYSDGLKRDSTTTWSYCTMPDRRFYSELLYGLEAADMEQITNDHPARDIPPFQYDVGDGFYDPRTKCVTDPNTGEILRIPTVAEENWILANCRAAKVKAVGYNPSLYENWFQSVTDLQSEQGESSELKEILELIMQKGYELDSAESRRNSQSRRMSLQSKFDFFKYEDLQSVSSIWSRTTGDFEEFLRKIIKDMAEGKQRYSLRLDADDQKCQLDSQAESKGGTIDEHIDSSLFNLLYDISRSFSEYMLQSRADSEQLFADSRRELPKSWDEKAISHVNIIGPILQSGTSITTEPFYYSDYYSDVSASTGAVQPPSPATRSTVQFKIDYADYESADIND